VATHLVQIANGEDRRVALVEEPYLRCLVDVTSVYELAHQCLQGSRSLRRQISKMATGDRLSYESIYAGDSEWRLLSPIDIPDQPSRMLVSGTGLTHVGSASQRQSMHFVESTDKPREELTDSMRMFKWGIEQGRPAEGEIGIAPEWFYKGDGSSVRAPFEALDIPSHAEDGGEEAELAGVYIVDADRTPYRIGYVQGNEFSDHKFEKRNYLNLAGSKLRTCSIGPELVIGADFAAVPGRVQVIRSGMTLWEKKIMSGEQSMCHSLTNIEHHHFKFEGHRQPGSVHVHFFGADSLSFGDGIELKDGDVVEVRFDGFGRALRNRIHEEPREQNLVRVRSLA
jgi:hypothetical protein